MHWFIIQYIILIEKSRSKLVISDAQPGALPIISKPRAIDWFSRFRCCLLMKSSFSSFICCYISQNTPLEQGEKLKTSVRGQTRGAIHDQFRDLAKQVDLYLVKLPSPLSRTLFDRMNPKSAVPAFVETAWNAASEKNSTQSEKQFLLDQQGQSQRKQPSSRRVRRTVRLHFCDRIVFFVKFKELIEF